MTNDAIALLQKKKIDFSNQKIIDVLRATVAQDTSMEEFAVFAAHCKATGLNPLKNEVWCVKAYPSAPIKIMTGINGYHRIANSHEQYDGMESEFKYDSNGRLHSCIVRVFRKDRSRPHVGTAIFAEVKGPDKSQRGKDTVWGLRPHQMLEKCAESFALRKAFPVELGGTYTSEEMVDEFSSSGRPALDVTPQAEVVNTHTGEVVEYPSKEQLGQLTGILKQLNCKSLEDCRKWSEVALGEKGVQLSRLTIEQYDKLMKIATVELKHGYESEEEPQAEMFDAPQPQGLPEQYQDAV